MAKSLMVWILELIIFGVVTAGGLVIRSWGISGPEYPFQNAVIQALFNSPGFAPQDIWYAGHTLNYYYFGYYPFVIVSKLFSQAFAFNYYFPFFYGILATTLFFVLYKAFGSRQRGLSIIGTALILFSGSLFSAIFVIYRLLSFLPLSSVVTHSKDLYLGAVFLTKADLGDFPANNFLLGNLHPYVLNQFYVLLLFGLLLWILHQKRKLMFWLVLPLSLILAAILLTNPWDFLIYGFLMFLVFLKKFVDGPGLHRILVLMVCSFGGALALAIPFLVTYKPPVSTISPILECSSYLIYFPLFVGLFLGPYLISVLKIKPVRQDWPVVFPAAILVIAWMSLIFVRLYLHGVGEVSPVDIFLKLLYQVPLLFLLTICGKGLLKSIKEEGPLGFLVATCFFVAVLLANVVELFYVRDGLNVRFNTFFKLYYNVWLLGSMGFVFGLPKWRLPLKVLLVYLVIGLIYPIYFLVMIPKPTTSLSDLPIIKSLYSTDVAAIAWIRSREDIRGAVILEGATYTSRHPRISTFTGHPTLIGIVQGYLDLNRPPEDFGTTVDDIKTIYTTSNITTFKKLTTRYHINYIYLGKLEKEYFGASTAGSFEGFGLQKIYDDGFVSLFKV